MTSKLENIISKAKITCAERSVKLTTKRERVLSVIASAEQAISPYELSDLYYEKFGQSIPAMSVYRILDFLAELSIVHKLSSANKYIACSHTNCSTTHNAPQFLICEGCQSVQEISLAPDVIASLADNVEQNGFILTNSQLELKGRCAKCQSHD